ncbi:MAG: hypothetical protein Q8M06_00225 [Methanobacteriaceae archaeon]|nr:hypothetical protein [Methanobacteriaceae archaeon]
MNLTNIISNQINRNGNPVKITNKKYTGEKTGTGHKKYTTTIKTVTAVIKINSEDDKIINNKFIMKKGDATGLFKKEDHEYLNQNNLVEYTSQSGFTYKFSMQKPIETDSHIEVHLIGRD